MEKQRVMSQLGFLDIELGQSRKLSSTGIKLAKIDEIVDRDRVLSVVQTVPAQ